MKKPPHTLPEINCDLGEGVLGEELIFPYLDAASVACGGHTGTAESIRATLELAKKFGKKAGAHPSYPDRENFGRKSMFLTPEALKSSLIEQIQAFLHEAEVLDMPMDHIKFHGALYNDAAKVEGLADLLTDVLASSWPEVPVFVPPHSCMEEMAKKKGLPYRLELFGDRAYLANFQLAPRSSEGSLLTELKAIQDHLMPLFQEGQLRTIDGQMIAVKADTLCFHGDNPGIHNFLPYLRKTYWS